LVGSVEAVGIETNNRLLNTVFWNMTSCTNYTPSHSGPHRHENLTSGTSSIRISNVFTFTSVLQNLLVIRDFLTEGRGPNSCSEDARTSSLYQNLRTQAAALEQ